MSQVRSYVYKPASWTGKSHASSSESSMRQCHHSADGQVLLVATQIYALAKPKHCGSNFFCCRDGIDYWQDLATKCIKYRSSIMQCVLTQNLSDGPYLPPLDVKSVSNMVSRYNLLSASHRLRGSVVWAAYDDHAYLYCEGLAFESLHIAM